MPNWELLQEAERRGILPQDKTDLLSEARNRGLVPGPSGPPTIPAPVGPSSLWDRFKEGPSASKEIAGIGTGIYGTLEGLLHLPSAAMEATRTIPEAIRNLRESPAATIPELGQAVRTFATGMVPYGRTVEGLLRGELPKPGQLGEETGGLLAGMFGPKMVGGAVKRGYRGLVKELPGAGVELHAQAIPKADALAESVQPGRGAVSGAYAQAESMGNPNLDMGNLRSVAENIRTHELAATKPNADLIAQTENILGSSEAGWDWQHAISEVRRMGEQQRAYKRIHGEVPKEMTDLYSALRNSVDEARPLIVDRPAQPARSAGTLVDTSGQPLSPARERQPAVTRATEPTTETLAQNEAWNAAQHTARRQFAGEELANRINTATGRAGESFNSISVNNVLRWIDQQERGATLGHPDTKARRFVESFDPGELAGIKSKLEGIAGNLAALPTIRGTPTGSGMRVLYASLGEIIGRLTGHGPYTGGAIGIAGTEGLSRLLQTEPGRGFIRHALEVKPTTSPLFNTAGFTTTQGARAGNQSSEMPNLDALLNRVRGAP